MIRYMQASRGRTNSTWKSRVLDMLSGFRDKLSWFFLYGVLFPLGLFVEVIVLILFLLLAKYDSITGCEDIEDFSRHLEYFGVYDLPCGGGIITNPGGATRWLRRGYGQKGTVSRCILLLSKGPFTNDLEKIITGVACGVLYKLGNLTSIEKLRKLRNEFLQELSSPDATPEIQSDIQTRLKYIEALIAGLCQRLGMVIPDDIPALDEDGIRYWFYY